MQVGVFISEAWGEGSSVAEVRERAARAEELGYPSGWVPYLPWAIDSLSAIQAAGESTEKMELGSAVIPTYFFHPLALARQAATVQSAIARPLHLGIGCSNPAVIAMHGLPFERPARHVREYLEVLNAALEIGPKPTGPREQSGVIQFEGEFFRVGSIYGTPGAQASGSVLVGALGPHMLRVAGAYSDGVIATWSDAGAIARVVAPAVTQAAAAAGRPKPRIASVVATAIVPSSRAEAARDAAQAEFGFYQGNMPYKRVVDASDAGRIADICVIGDEDEVARRLIGFREAGLTDFLAAPFTVEGATWEDTAKRLATISCSFRDNP